MTGTKIISKAYRLTNTNATTFLDGDASNILEELNTLYGHRILDILRVKVDQNAKMQNATTDLISTDGLTEGDNGYNGEYAFPGDLLRPIRVEVSFDGTNWYKAQIYDNNTNQESEYNEDQINELFSQTSPRVDFFRNSYKIRPTKTTSGNISNGIYIEYEKRQSDFTTTTEPSDIETNLQDILAYDLAELELIMHSEAHNPTQITLLRTKRAEVKQKFLDFYKTRLPNKKRLTIKYNNYK